MSYEPKGATVKHWVTNSIAIGAILVTVGGYIFEVRNNSSEIRVLKNDLARKDVMTAELKSIQHELSGLREDSQRAASVSEKNQDLLIQLLRKQP